MMVLVFMLQVFVPVIPASVFDLFRMTAMMMVFTYHGSFLFPKAKVRRPGCNWVAIIAGNAYLSGH